MMSIQDYKTKVEIQTCNSLWPGLFDFLNFEYRCGLGLVECVVVALRAKAFCVHGAV